MRPPGVGGIKQGGWTFLDSLGEDSRLPDGPHPQS